MSAPAIARLTVDLLQADGHSGRDAPAPSLGSPAMAALADVTSRDRCRTRARSCRPSGNLRHIQARSKGRAKQAFRTTHGPDLPIPVEVVDAGPTFVSCHRRPLRSGDRRRPGPAGGDCLCRVNAPSLNVANPDSTRTSQGRSSWDRRRSGRARAQPPTPQRSPLAERQAPGLSPSSEHAGISAARSTAARRGTVVVQHPITKESSGVTRHGAPGRLHSAP